ncbi:MAG: hypothetical protein ACXWC9_05090 [Pseudobdellovibrionaceae bacterium]
MGIPLICLTLLLVVSSQSNAQFASASLFPDIKSTNPAVINQRPQKAMAATVRAEVINREQKLEIATGSAIDADSKTDIAVNSGGIFFGGKGPGTTAEFAADYITGTKNDKAESLTESHEMQNKAYNYLLHLGLGFTENFGISVSSATYNSDFNFSETFQGQPVSDSFTTDVNALDIKMGVRKAKGNFAFGAFFLHSTANVQFSGAGNNMDTTSEDDVFGVALGTDSQKFHFEMGYERAVDSNTDPFTNKTLYPTRLTGTIEANFGSFSAGYMGRYYMDGFFEIERVIFNQFVYENSYTEPRLDNTFNFSFGTNKGGSISASIYYSVLKSEEVNTFFQQGPKVDTKTTAKGASLSYSHRF